MGAKIIPRDSGKPFNKTSFPEGSWFTWDGTLFAVVRWETINGRPHAVLFKPGEGVWATMFPDSACLHYPVEVEIHIK